MLHAVPVAAVKIVDLVKMEISRSLEFCSAEESKSSDEKKSCGSYCNTFDFGHFELRAAMHLFFTRSRESVCRELYTILRSFSIPLAQQAAP